MDAATEQRLLAQWEQQNPKPRMADDAAKQQALVDRWNKREKYLKETGGFGGGVQRFVDAAGHALINEPVMALAQMTGQADQKAVDRMRADADHLTSTNVGKLGSITGGTIVPALVGGGTSAALGKTINAMKNLNTTRNAIGGAASGAVIPTGTGENRAVNMIGGAVMSGLPSLIKKGITQPIRPTEQAQKLIDAGIYPTPGQAAGGVLNSVEQAATGIPGFSPFVSTARAKPFQDYVRQVQKSYGYTGDRTGRLATQEMADIADQKYENVLPKLQLEVTPELRAKYLRNTQGLRPNEVGAFEDTLKYELDPLLSKSNANMLSGDDLNKWQSVLRSESQNFKNAASGHEKKLAKAYGTSRDDTLNAIDEQGLVSDGVANEYADARKYYAGLRNLAELGESGGAAKRAGMFTPDEHLGWMKRNEGVGTGSLNFARNNVQGQDLAQAASDVLGKTPHPDLAGKLAMLSVMKDPSISWTEGLVGGSLSAASPQWARRTLVGDTAWQKALSKGLRRAGFDNPWATSTESSLFNVGTEKQNEF